MELWKFKIYVELKSSIDMQKYAEFFLNFLMID